MSVCGCVLALVLSVGAPPTSTPSDPRAADKAKPDPARVTGLKAAVADIDAGKLRLRVPSLPAPAWYADYLDLLKVECGVEAEHVREFTGAAGAELAGYNAVMTLEIEHRFGTGVLKKLQEKAERRK